MCRSVTCATKMSSETAQVRLQPSVDLTNPRSSTKRTARLGLCADAGDVFFRCSRPGRQTTPTTIKILKPPSQNCFVGTLANFSHDAFKHKG